MIARSRCALLGLVATAAITRMLPAQSMQLAREGPITRIDLATGRSFPITTSQAITRVSVADTNVADVVVISDRELVINGKKAGETDAILWMAAGPRQQYRVQVRSSPDRQQIALYVRFAEVRRDLVRTLGTSLLFRDQHTRVGTGDFNTDNGFTTKPDGQRVFNIPGTAQFGTVLSDLGTNNLLALLNAEEQAGHARELAEPSLMAANREEATFLAGGELPIPVVQGGGSTDNSRSVTIMYREFGVKLRFIGEIISDSLIKLAVTPEVSSLDYTNAITLDGFRIPALRTRRMTSTLDVRKNQSLVISGMFDDQTDVVKTGIPYLKDLPILGLLFSSKDFQRHETELIIVVTPVIVDPMHPRPQDVVPTPPDTARPAFDALKRVPPSAKPPPKKP
jgi:pilus assembly protein CpaC